MSNVAVIGDSTTILGFRPLGVDIYAAEPPGRHTELLMDVLSKNYAVIFISESVFRAAEPLIAGRSRELAVSIVPIPSAAGATGAGSERLDRLVETATGAPLGQGRQQ